MWTEGRNPGEKRMPGRLALEDARKDIGGWIPKEAGSG